MRKIIWGCILAVMMTVILGCNNTSAEAASAISLMIDGKKVNKSTYNVTAGETMILSVDTGELKNVKSISYKSTRKSVASVTKDGTIEAKKKGSAKIKVTVKYGKKTRKSWVKILVEEAKPDTAEDIAEQEGKQTMVMMIGDTKVDVTWENNASVDTLKELAAGGLTIPMSMYGGFEQVGPIGKSITRNDKQTTTSAGDIVLYSGNQLVVFYGSNSWSYTRLGKIDLSVEELTKLLSNGDVTITLTNGEKDTQKNKILVAYFSATGNTAPLAQYAADILNADLYEIVPEQPYTEEDLAYYTDCRADREQNDPNARPAIKGSVKDMSKYDTIVIGHPIWHGQAPRIISTFLESYDFSGKTLVTFCTSHSSGLGSSAKNLYSLVSDSTTWLESRRFPIGASREDVKSWLDEIGM